MPADDPTAELGQIIDLGELNVLPPQAVGWAVSVLTQSESILRTIDSMLENGVDAPTEKQALALQNMYFAALSWLPGQHVIDSYATQLVALRERREARKHASGGPSLVGSVHRHPDNDLLPIERRPIAPREAAIDSILDAAQRLGVISEHPTYKIPNREDKPFRLVLGDPDRVRGPALYHQGNCPVFATEIHHSKLCSANKPRIKLLILKDAKQHGIACPVCLLGLAKARKEHLRLKPCRVLLAETKENGLLLRWRKDTENRWQGLILRPSHGSVICEVFARNDLEPLPD